MQLVEGLGRGSECGRHGRAASKSLPSLAYSEGRRRLIGGTAYPAPAGATPHTAVLYTDWARGVWTRSQRLKRGVSELAAVLTRAPCSPPRIQPVPFGHSL